MANGSTQLNGKSIGAKKRLACTTVSYANFARNTEDSHAPGPTKDQHAVEALAAYGDSARQDLGPSA
jgi:hypothetical protein